MTDKTLYKLRLGDAEVSLKFNIGMLRRLKTILGKDPMTAIIGADTVEILEFAQAVVQAAITEPFDGLEAAFNELSPYEATAIITAFRTGISPDTAPEVGDNTQQGEASDA